VILFTYARASRFTELDRAALARRWRVRDWPARPSLRWALATVGAVARAEAVVGWFAGWHTLLPVWAARALRRPAILVVGGFDVAAVPEIGYGSQRGGWRRCVARAALRGATRLVVNSEFSRAELAGNAGVADERVVVVHHGLPDPYGALPDSRAGAGPPVVLTAGVVDRDNLERKGLRTFAAAAALVPEARWVLAGRWDGDAAQALRAAAPANLELTGWLERDALDDLMRRAAVYVQASRHEGFGLSVVEAMLAGCLPVVTPAGALPEVVGDAGVIVDGSDAHAVAAGVRAALARGPEARRAARERALEAFPLARREAGLSAVLESALARRRA
jgi:glycosyltransferase involved in cell wall biosynthesis